MPESFSILDKIANSDRLHLVSAADLRVLANELEMHGAYQILARESGSGNQIEIFVTYEKIGD